MVWPIVLLWFVIMVPNFDGMPDTRGQRCFSIRDWTTMMHSRSISGTFSTNRRTYNYFVFVPFAQSIKQNARSGSVQKTTREQHDVLGEAQSMMPPRLSSWSAPLTRERQRDRERERHARSDIGAMPDMSRSLC